MNIFKVFVRKSCWTINKVFPLPTSLFRFILSFVNDKDLYVLKKSENVFSNIYEYNFWQSSESRSGGGSTMEATVAIRKKLPLIFDEYSINSILDVPCGDYNWMKTIDKSNLTYIGGDIVSDIVIKNNELFQTDRISFRTIDITKDSLPKVDLIFCRDCLQHLSEEKVIKALNNFKRSGARYLLTTSYPKTWRNYDVLDGDYRAINLLIAPFCLPSPILSIKETINIGNEKDKVLLLFKIEDISIIK